MQAIKTPYYQNVMEMEYKIHCEKIKKTQDERIMFDDLSKEEKMKRVRFHLENVLEYEDCLEEYTNEETDALAYKIVNGANYYPDPKQKKALNMFYSCYEESINDANYEIQYIYDRAISATFSQLHDTIYELIISGNCMNLSTETYVANNKSSYQKIKELLDRQTNVDRPTNVDRQTNDNDNTLTTNELNSLCEAYRFVTHDVHGYYPDDSFPMMRLLRSAKIWDEY
jgi:hypothetical protein